MVFGQLSGLLDAEDFELFRKNSKSVFYEPQVGAAAHALAATLDRGRHGTLPQSCIRNAVVRQAAMLAANLAVKPQWPAFRPRLQDAPAESSKLVVAAAIALGWSQKWRRA
jgi:hypothetical protein